MTARRSQDPTAREHDEGISSAAEHWTPQRRRNAIPALREAPHPTTLPSGQEDPERRVAASEERALDSEKPEPTCENGYAATGEDSPQQE